LDSSHTSRVAFRSSTTSGFRLLARHGRQKQLRVAFNSQWLHLLRISDL
jgi:hypothetical protein